MGTSLLASTAVSGLDATPRVAPTAGEGGHGYLQEVDGYVTSVAADDTNSTYRIVRVPSTAKVKGIWLDSVDVGASGAIDIGVAYATNHRTGAGAVISQQLFASAVDVNTAALVRVDVTNESGNYTIDKRNQPLWQAAGLTSDPGGHFDIIIRPQAAIGATGGVMGLTVKFVD